LFGLIYLITNIFSVDGYEYNIGDGHKIVFHTNGNEECLNEFIKRYLEK